jgi:hypothetical protein
VELDTSNKFFVSGHSGSDDVSFLRPVPSRIARGDALVLAAYIVSIADPLGNDFRAVLRAVQSS